MKQIQLIILTIILSQQVFGINFFNGTYNEAIMKASVENKAILLDFGAKWCGPCHRMEKNILSNYKITKYTNKHFITLKIDIDTKEGNNLKDKFEVQGVPHYLIINTSEKVLAEVKGKLSVNEFINFLKFQSSTKQSTNQKLAKDDAITKYEQSKKDFHDLLVLIRILNRQGLYNTSLDYLNDYPINLKKNKQKFVYLDCLRENYKLSGLLNDTLRFRNLENSAYIKKLPYSEVKLLEHIYYKENGNYDAASASLVQYLYCGYKETKSKMRFFSQALNYLIEYGYGSDRKMFVINHIDQLFKKYPKELSKYKNLIWCQRSILYHKCIFLDALGSHVKAEKIAKSIINQYPLKGFTKPFFVSEFKEELERIIQN